ncbi:RHS repeat domain-containing protein [Serratia fonticola]|uniref:RHS repeat domain-containing protein n=1 Tax=Serratia fonticola TaxID=47917 RepID=UPI00093D5AAC|nr:RHS repeat-associated core domain-containing protein [Serratia fonticola]OKP23020.1 hypothetical protein BSQ40_25310 [Serratia fonticola]
MAGEGFLYDAAGNRVSKHGERDSAPGNWLAFFGDRHFEYDRFGNLAVERRGKAHKLVTTFAYDCRHRLIKRTDPHGQVTTYTYNAFNRRTSKTVEGQTTEYLWQGNKLIAETDNQQHWQTFLYEPGSHRPMATVVGSTRVNSPKIRTYWYQNDHLGTPHSLTDNQGNTVWRGQYSAYGQLTEEWTPPDARDEHPQPKVNNPLRFQGQYEDTESGLYYNLNRYYDPGVGRYLTADPVKLDGGLNQYGYVDNNPVNWVDPLGLKGLPGFDNQATGNRSPEPEIIRPQENIYIPRDQNGNPIELAKQRVNGQDIPLPHPDAEGRAHTVLGGKVSSEGGGVYRQSAEFPENTWPLANGQPVPISEVQWGDHGKPHHHSNPHQHPFIFDGEIWLRTKGNQMLPFNTATRGK